MDDIIAFSELGDFIDEPVRSYSTGMRARLGFSVVTTLDPEILILDDVLSSVDTQTEAALMKKLQPVLRKRTTLFISHRISTLRYADEIVVIEEGRITQRGTHADLVTQPGYYAQLNALQQIQRDMEVDS